ncbi:hypothetical protein Fot_57129 [Forsythia ovata]|uniref:Uncharacterized protein n=1 Tax=Forsythia ovata TaxID=205694 RepID=A0ABD1NWM7_9LAMI
MAKSTTIEKLIGLDNAKGIANLSPIEGGSEHNRREASFITIGGNSDPNAPSPSNCSDSKKLEKGTVIKFQIKGCSHRICSKRSSRRLQKSTIMENATMGSNN